MIQFLKKIRQNILMQNNSKKPTAPASRYFKYAIGEIALVVLGILIALQLNKWNESRKYDQLKSVYLSRLINDLKQDTSNINYVISEVEENQKAITVLIKSIESDSNYEHLDSIITGYFKSGWIISSFVPTANTYTDLSQTGNMNILKNFELINEIIQYYGYLKQVENSNTINMNWITPMDLEVAKVTAAFEIDPSTKGLFSHKNRNDAINDIQKNSNLLERNAAGHFWINASLVRNLTSIKGLTIDLLNSLQNETKK